MDDGIYSNRKTKRDFVRNIFSRYVEGSPNIYIATAFFTDSTDIELLNKKGCRIRLVVRLGFPTNPKALARIVFLPNVEIRYFTAKEFHPKLYIFGNEIAVVGSANLTNNGLSVNQEIMVTINSHDDRFNKLAGLFNDYWDQAQVLNADILDKYSRLYADYNKPSSEISILDSNIIAKLGKVIFQNILRDKKRVSKENLFFDNFQKTYQEFFSAFNIIREVYEGFGIRKVEKDKIPVRLEIDSFLSFVRENQAKGDKWEKTPTMHGDEQKDFILQNIKLWHETDHPHFSETIVEKNYPLITKILSNSKSIKDASDELLFNALLVLHSFENSKRFYMGGLPTLTNSFFSQNQRNQINESLSYLLFGKDDIIRRMANLIFNDEYRINCFGPSSVQELIGWINKEKLPIINGRTTKVLHYMGFDIKQM